MGGFNAVVNCGWPRGRKRVAALQISMKNAGGRESGGTTEYIEVTHASRRAEARRQGRSLGPTALLVGVLCLPGVVFAQSVSPASASPGGANVALTMSGLPAGTINPAQVQLTFTPTLPSSGPTVTTAATGVESVYGSEGRIFFRVPSSLTFSAPVAYGISVAGPNFTSASVAAFTVNPPASIQSITPNYALPGQSVGVAIAALFSNLTPNVTIYVPITADGVAVTSITIISPTSATAQLQISPTAPLGTINFTLQTGVELASISGGFTVSGPPSIQSVSPASGSQGTTVSLNVTGVNTHFGSGSVVAFSGTGITLNGISVSSPTSLSASVTIAANAAVGSQNITITSGTEVVSSTFSVVPPAPAITSVSPSTGAQSTSVSMTITGQNTHFSAGSVVTFSGSGITMGALSGITTTSLTVALTISPGASVGAQNVTVTTGSEVATAAGAFTVVPLSAPVTGVITLSDGVTPVSGALVRLYQGSTPTLAAPQVTAAANGSYTFAGVTGAFTVIALNAAQTQVGIGSGQVQSLAPVTQNVALSGNGQVTVDVFDSNGTPVPNANVTVALTSIGASALPVPTDLAATLTASAVANGSGVATVNSFFAGSMFVSAGDPVTNHGGTATGSVAGGGSVTIPLYFNINEATADIFSVLNGVVPGTVGPTGANEAPFWIFSVLNGTEPGTTGATGTNEAPFWIFSVLNGTEPGTTGPAGTNEAPFWIFSVLNGTIPGSTISMGANETVFPVFSVLNGAAISNVVVSSLKSEAAAAAASGAGVVNKAHVVLPAERVAAGQTIQIAATLDRPAAGTTVEFFINGVSFGSYAAPYRFALTVPYTVSALRVTAAADGVLSEEAVASVTAQAGTRMRGRVVGADGAPAQDRTVSLEYSGLKAELFHFTAPLTSMPDLTGLTPVAVKAVSGLDLRNPGGVFGKDPLATGLAPDYVVRFSASLDVAADGDYVFSLRGQEGVALRVGGKPVSDGARVRLTQGSVALEATVFVGAGPMETQLLWQAPGQLMGPVGDGLLWVRESGMSAVTDLGGAFEFERVPGEVGLVRAVVDGVASAAMAVTGGDFGLIVKRLGKE